MCAFDVGFLNTKSYLDYITHKFMKQKEDILLLQLNDLISRGLLVIEETCPTLIKAVDSDEIKLSQSVKLTLKDKEYIEKLEKENVELKKQLMDLKDIFKIYYEEKDI